MQEIKQKKLEEAMLEQKRLDEEILRKARLEREKADKKKIEQIIKVITDEVPVTAYDLYIKYACTIMGEITLDGCKTRGSLYITNAQIEYNDPQTLNKNWAGKVWLDIFHYFSTTREESEKIKGTQIWRKEVFPSDLHYYF